MNLKELTLDELLSLKQQIKKEIINKSSTDLNEFAKSVIGKCYLVYGLDLVKLTSYEVVFDSLAKKYLLCFNACIISLENIERPRECRLDEFFQSVEEFNKCFTEIPTEDFEKMYGLITQINEIKSNWYLYTQPKQ